MGEKSIVRSRYEYVHEKGNWPSSVVLEFPPCFERLRCLLLKLPIHRAIWISSFCVTCSLVCSFSESVVILPAFGVQLETHYRSGRVIRRFIPIDKILKPVLNECVTPITCYWSLALLVREEDKLMLVFKELLPSLEMLAPIWKALCAGTDSVSGSAISMPRLIRPDQTGP